MFRSPEGEGELSKATSIATKTVTALPQSFFSQPVEVVAFLLIGCLLVKRQEVGELLWGVIVETEAYSQEEPACHCYRRRTPSNETWFGEPKRFYVNVGYGIHHCVKRVRGFRSKKSLLNKVLSARAPPTTPAIPPEDAAATER